MDESMETGTMTFTVTDLKQYEYCPRIVYYTYCLPLIRPTTFKMEAGVQAHETRARLGTAAQPEGLSPERRRARV